MWPQWPCPPCFMGALGTPPAGLPLHRAGWPWKGLHLSSVLWDRPLTPALLTSVPAGSALLLERTQLPGAEPPRHSRTNCKEHHCQSPQPPHADLQDSTAGTASCGPSHSLWGHTGPVVLGITRAGSGSQWGLSGDKVPLPAECPRTCGHPPRALTITQFGKTDSQ